MRPRLFAAEIDLPCLCVLNTPALHEAAAIRRGNRKTPRMSATPFLLQ